MNNGNNNIKNIFAKTFIFNIIMIFLLRVKLNRLKTVENPICYIILIFFIRYQLCFKVKYYTYLLILLIDLRMALMLYLCSDFYQGVIFVLILSMLFCQALIVLL